MHHFLFFKKKPKSNGYIHHFHFFHQKSKYQFPMQFGKVTSIFSFCNQFFCFFFFSFNFEIIQASKKTSKNFWSHLQLKPTSECPTLTFFFFPTKNYLSIQFVPICQKFFVNLSKTNYASSKGISILQFLSKFYNQFYLKSEKSQLKIFCFFRCVNFFSPKCDQFNETIEIKILFFS